MSVSPTSHPDPGAGRRAAIRMLLKYLEFKQLTDEEAREAAGIPAVVFTEDGLPIVTASWCRCRDLRRYDLIEPVWASRDGKLGYLARRGASGKLRVACQLTVRGKVFAKRLARNLEAEWPAAPDKPGERVLSRYPRFEANPPGPPWDPGRE